MTTAQTTHPPTQIVQDINLLTTFLSHTQLTSLTPPITTTTNTQINPTTLIIAPSSILSQAHTVFTHLQTLPSSHPLHTLLLTGGIGHSTLHLYTAIPKSQPYHTLPSLLPPQTHLTTLPESTLYSHLLTHFHSNPNILQSQPNSPNNLNLNLLIEDHSTNCGENAQFSRTLLESHDIHLGSSNNRDSSSVEDVIIVQDPTMSLRTQATFERVYAREVGSQKLRFWCWPVFTPRVRLGGNGDEVVWDGEGMGSEVDVGGLWEMKRFYGLILGEISRLRDDEGGYGPKGKGFIVHVDVPEEIERAWERLREVLEVQR